MKKVLSIVGLLFTCSSVYPQWDSIGLFPATAEITSETVAYYFNNEAWGTPSVPYAVATLYKSTDGWNTWETIYSTGNPENVGYIPRIHFNNDTVGYMSLYLQGAGGFMQTTDGGLSWKSITGGPVGHLYSFPRADYGYVFRGFNNFLELYNYGSWSIQCTLSDLPAFFNRFEFINDSVGFIFYKNISPNLGRTENFAVTWDYPGNELGIVNLLCFPDDMNGYCINSDNQLFVSHNQGSIWTQMDTLPFSGLNVLYFLNKDTGWIAGKQGKICKTVNGGVSWAEVPSSNEDEILELRFFNDTTGYYISQRIISGKPYHYLYKTISGPGNIEEPIAPNLIQITPNPAQTVLNLSVNNPQNRIGSLEIYSITGKRIFLSEQFTDKIDITGYSEGIYILYYRIKGRCFSSKFIVL